jgi:hypothetical protein
MPVICLMREADYFLRGEWTEQITLELFGKLASGRIAQSVCKKASRTFSIYTRAILLRVDTRVFKAY